MLSIQKIRLQIRTNEKRKKNNYKKINNVYDIQENLKYFIFFDTEHI